MKEQNPKFIIVGFNASGKMQVANTLRNMDIRVGDIFRSTESTGNLYSLSTVVYDVKEINNLFENQSYLLRNPSPKVLIDTMKVYRFMNTRIRMYLL